MAVNFLLGFLKEILSDIRSLAISQNVPNIPSVFSVNSEKEKLISTMSRIKAVLSDAQNQTEKSHTDEDWIQKLQDILDDAEDLVEEFSVEEQRRVDDNRSMTDKVLSFFSSRWFYTVKASEMKTIRDRLNDAAEDYSKIPPVQQDAGSKDKNKETNEPQPYKPPTEVIGREEDQKAIKQLIKESSDEENVSVVPIIGIGGMGKTTLARLVFEDEEAMDFALKMWVWVSTDFNVENLVKKVIEAATDAECPNLGLSQLQTRLRGKLAGKKYLLVLDDVWNKNRQSWIALDNLLKGGARGSVILVTTRDRDVALIMGTVPPYELRDLNEDDCWSLFQQQLAFKPRQMEEYPELLSLGKEILQKCGGIPLAITTVAGLLYGEYTESEWSKVNNQLWELAQEDNDILPTLRVSYAHLSSDLQKCFAHCSLFPKGSEIEKASLIQLWMAQALIQLEEAGDEYFKILWKRSFFQDGKIDAYGNIISCKMHDLMHDLAQTVAGSEYATVNDGAANISDRVIHASVNVSHLEEIPTSLVNARKLRTFLRRGSNREISIQDFDKFPSIFKSLRVLDLVRFSCRGSSDVLNSIGKLKRLRYLDISRSDIETLPNSICKLQNLLTLKLNYCKFLTELPRDIKKLVSLRHLEIYGCDKLKGMPYGFGQLTSMQTLPVFVLGIGDGLALSDQLISMPFGFVRLQYIPTSPTFVLGGGGRGGGLSELEGLNNLRGALEIKNLGISENDTSETRKAYLKEKKHLQTLTLCWPWHAGNAEQDFALLEDLQPNPNLKGLHIKRYNGVRFPSWMFNMGNSLPYLVQFTLQYCPSCVCFPPFAELRFLKVLKLSFLDSLEYIDSYIRDSSSSSSTLSSSFRGNILCGAGRWFPSLQKVELYYLGSLKEWSREVVEVNDGKALIEAVAEQQKQLLSLNSLAKLTIFECPKLISMPLHPDVEELTLNHVSRELIQSITMAATISPTTATTSLLASSFTLFKLKYLEIRSCKDLASLPEKWLVNLISLERLEIEDCPELESLSQETQHLTAPDMLRTSKVRELDSSEQENDLQRFTSLHSLKLHYLPKLMSLPKGLQHATKLKELSIHSCDSLVTLFESIGNVRSLQSLAIVNCKKLTSLPRGLQHLTALENLEIQNCPQLNVSEDDNDMPDLRSLHSLQLSGLSKLLSLPKMYQHTTTLKILMIKQCPGLMNLPVWLGNLTSLRQLTISNCDRLKSLPEGICCLTALQELTISGCLGLMTLPERFGNLTSLWKLIISNCNKLKYLPEEMCCLTPLQELTISGCLDLMALPDRFGNLTSLRQLTISNCVEVKSLPEGMHCLTALQQLTISRCPGLMTLSDQFGNLTSLRELTISNCDKLKSLPEGMRCLTALQQLTIESCPYLWETCREETGKDWPKIAHIPRIYIDGE